jgi:urea transporter
MSTARGAGSQLNSLDNVAAQAGAVGGAINFGFIGFNGVLVANYVIIASDLRLVVPGSILATWLGSYVYRGAPVPVLASGFVLAVWTILALGWLNPTVRRQAGGTESRASIRFGTPRCRR